MSKIDNKTFVELTNVEKFKVYYRCIHIIDNAIYLALEDTFYNYNINMLYRDWKNSRK